MINWVATALQVGRVFSENGRRANSGRPAGRRGSVRNAELAAAERAAGRQSGIRSGVTLAASAPLKTMHFAGESHPGICGHDHCRATGGAAWTTAVRRDYRAPLPVGIMVALPLQVQIITGHHQGNMLSPPGRGAIGLAK